MSVEILTQILVIVFIIVGILLIGVLVRLLGVLGDVKGITTVVLKRVKEIDESIDKAKQTLGNMIEAIKGFVFSFDIIKSIKNRFNKGGQDE